MESHLACNARQKTRLARLSGTGYGDPINAGEVPRPAGEREAGKGHEAVRAGAGDRPAGWGRGGSLPGPAGWPGGRLPGPPI